MAKLNKEWALVFLLFLAVLGIRLFLAFQTHTLTSDSYFAIRQAEQIKATGLPLFNDPLSYSGRVYFFQPFFHYILALLLFFAEAITAAKIVTSLCFAALTIVVYMIVKQMTKNRWISLFAAIFAGFVPAFYSNINTVSPTTLNIVLVFLLAYAFLRIEEKGYGQLSIFLAILSILTSTELFLLISGLFFYSIMLFLERSHATKKESEVTLFLFFLAIWFSILLYKLAFLNSGIKTLWANVPRQLLSNYFSDISYISILYSVGLIPLLLGVYAIYSVVFETKNRAAQLFIGISMSSFLALWLKIIPLEAGVMFLSTSIIILSGHTMKAASNAFAKMKSARLPAIFVFIMLLVFAFTTAPTFLSFKPQEPQLQADMDAMNWLRENTDPESVVAGRVEEGFLINYYSGRKNVADQNFLYVKDADKIYADVESIYTSRFAPDEIRILDKYDVDYVLLSKKTKGLENLTSLYYADPGCFESVYDHEATIYKFKGCTI
jgi:hypothetical protein